MLHRTVSLRAGFPFVAFLGIVAVLAIASASFAEDWPCFRGNGIDGISSENVSWDDGVTLQVAWKKLLGTGYSSVAVANGRAVTMFTDGESDYVIAFRESDGKELWRYKLEPVYVGHDGSHTGPISTPAIDGKQVFVLGAHGTLAALDVMTGKANWTVDFKKEFSADEPFYGFGGSPIMAEGVLVVGVGAQDATFVGFDPATGESLWKTGQEGVQYQTPISVTWNNKSRVLAAANKSLFCLDPKTGEIEWQKEHGGDGATGSGSLTPLSLGGSRVFMANKDKASTVIEVDSSGDEPEIQTIWEERSLRSSYNVPVYDGHNIYGNCSRFLSCVDPKSGERLWRSRAPGDGFTIMVDGHLVVLTKEGGLHIADVGPDGYSEIASLAVFDDLAWSVPSFSDGSFYLRSMGEIARVDVHTGKAAAIEEHGEGRDVPPGRFADLLKELEGTPDKKALVDSFMASVKSFPMIEGSNVVHFLYRGPAKDMAIASDFIGARQERRMTRVEGTDLFYYSTNLGPDVRTNYVFFEDYKPIVDPRNPRQTKSMVFDEDMNMNFTGQPLAMSWVAMPKWRTPDFLGDPSGPRGMLESHELDSEVMGKKHTIDVYLPAGYSATDRAYPVLYVHGGQTAREYGRFVESLDNLIGSKVAPLIAVFIHEGGFQQPKYGEMFAEELLPFIDGKYRTVKKPTARANYGAGFSAFDAVLCTFTNPNVVQKVAAQSLFLMDFLAERLGEYPTAKDTPMQIYVEWGRYDLRSPHEAWDCREDDEEFVRKLRANGYTVQGGEVADGTGWPSWQNRLDVVLAALFPIDSAER